MITEALLEMHFHSSLIELFSKTFGRNFLRLLKPSQQRECRVGFDQGWIFTDLPLKIFYDQLKENIAKSDTTFDKLYLAYFFQFKAVQEVRRNSSLKPPAFSTPYFRSELSLNPNNTTGISQHETLTRLSQIPNTEVSYACGMLFDVSELYQDPDLNNLRFVPLSNAPNGWVTNQRHFITFQTPDDANPLWCSKPTEGISFSLNQLLERQTLKLLTSKELIEQLNNINLSLMDLFQKKKFLNKDEQMELFYPDCFTIIEFDVKGV